MTAWSPDDARAMYQLPRWGEGLFDVDERGHLVVRPDGEDGHAGVDLHALVGQLQAEGLSPPVLVRFPGILQGRARALMAAFRSAMAAQDYAARYTAVYPVKVNQQRRVVEELLASGEGMGLEAGSKPELLAVLALAAPGGTIVCNGYKDREYIRLALLGQSLGHRVYIVIEKPSELALVLEEARALEVSPRLGLRLRLAAIARGKWQNTGGEKAKFGLTACQVLQAVEELRAAGRLDCLRMLHVHMGSQIANLDDIARGMAEAARYFAELHRLGATPDCVDVGGGLSVDYAGTRSRDEFSMNYGLDEYARAIVGSLASVCREQGLTPPDIMSESGRALTAHHAVLITNVIDRAAVGEVVPPPESGPAPPPVAALYADLRSLEAGAPECAPREIYLAARQRLDAVEAAYTRGELDLAARARAELLYQAIARRVRDRLPPGSASQRQLLDELNDKLADRYFCNMSIFQSLPDVWAIKQIFPIVPLHRLDERPTRRAVLEDITCDSDGRIDDYVDAAGVESTLPLHELRPGEPYYLGIFLVGAYQEILGDMHNLFGDTHSVHVVIDAAGRPRMVEPLHGDTVESVLRYVHFDPEALLARLRGKLGESRLAAAQRRALLEELEAGMRGYTYLED